MGVHSGDTEIQYRNGKYDGGGDEILINNIISRCAEQYLRIIPQY